MIIYDKFIAENVAPKNTEHIELYKNKLCVGEIPLGNLAFPTDSGEKQYSFGALSDVHITYNTAVEDFQTALTFLNETADVVFTCVCGDLTEDGSADELALYKSVVDSYSPNTPVYAISGNHEGTNAMVTDEMLLPYTGKPLYYSFTHNNDVFIMCGEYGWHKDYLFTTEELQWLYETLEENRNKRCFVFFHVLPWGDSGNAGGIYNPDITSGGNIFTGTQGSVFQSLMQHYKNITLFHGHSHLKFYLQEIDKKANYNNSLGFRSVHIPSLAVPRKSNTAGDGWEMVYADSEGYVVEVYENGVHLRGRDFVKGEYLPIASYWLDTTLQIIPANTYTDTTGTIKT